MGLEASEAQLERAHGSGQGVQGMESATGGIPVLSLNLSPRLSRHDCHHGLTPQCHTALQGPVVTVGGLHLPTGALAQFGSGKLAICSD